MADKANKIILTPEQTEQVSEALASKKAGEKGLSAEEVLENARAKVDSWLANQSA